MKKVIYAAIVLSCFLMICLKSNAQQNTHTTIPLGAPTVVNFTQAAAYARLHPQTVAVHCAEVEGEEEEKEGTGEEPPIGNGVKNDVQLNNPNLRTQSITSPAPALTTEGYSLMTTFPPDINGAAGINYIVMTTNEGVMIFNKSGKALDSTNLKAFFPTASTVNDPGVSIAPYDPHCCYDPNNDRFIVVCSGFLPSSGHGGVFLGVSKTGDPTGDWWEYFVDGTGNTTDLFDYPELGFNTNWIVVTGNVFGGWTTFSDNKVCVVDRAAAYNGTATGAIDVFTENSNGSVVTTISPALTDDNTQTTEWMTNNANGNTGGYGYVTLSTITGAVASPVYTLVSAPVGVNQPWSNTVITAPQKGGTEGLNMGDARIRNTVYRNGSLYFTHHVFLPAANPTRTSTDWWQVNPATQTVIQFGRIDDPSDTLSYIYPGIDVNSSGDVLLSFSETSVSMYAGAAYALHASGDALNYTEGSYIYKQGVAYYIRTDGNGNDRWGDFTGVAVDPTDGSFWCFSEWAQAETTWGTDVAHVIATPDTACNAPVALDTANITQTSVTLEWTAISQATYFTVQYKEVGASNWITDTTSSTFFNVTGLTTSTNYEFQVSNVCKSGSTSLYSSVFYFTTAAPCKTTAGFSAPVTAFCSAPATVNFTSASSINATSYYWTFGDGGTSADANPTYTYNSYNDYTVTLIATGCTVDTLSVSQYIHVDSTIACVVSLPTAGAGPTQTACSGNLYDSGGPDANYQNNTNTHITIAPSGAATVSVTFSTFDYESDYDYIYIYDGPFVTSPIIGQYTGNTLPNGGSPITSSGGSITIRQSSDDATNFSGFSLTWQCTKSTVKPVANFTSDITSSCAGIIQFYDLSAGGPTSWLWDFGDGNTSPLQNPQHVYLTSGTFTVKLTATNAYGSNTDTQTGYVTISLPTAPTASNPASVCSGNYAVLSASGTPTLDWYDAPTGGDLVGTGATLITPPLTATTTYYVESTSSESAQQVGPGYGISSFTTANFLTTTNYICQYFDCYSPFTLQSVVMYSSMSEPVEITLVQNGDTLQSTTVNIVGNSATDTVFTLNFNVPVGTNYQLGTSASNLFANFSGAAYPYTIPNVMSITGNNSGDAGYYFYFYQWEVDAPCTSARVPVTATVDQGPVISFTPNLTGSVCSFTNNTTGATQYSWNFDDPGSGANNVSTLQSPSHTFSSTGTFNVCLKATDSKGCKNTVCQNVAVLVLSTPVISDDANLSIYPNPVTNDLTIEFGTAYSGTKWTLKLNDILGNLVAKKTIANVATPGKYDWDLSGIARGAYILILQSNDETLMRKIIRQ